VFRINGDKVVYYYHVNGEWHQDDISFQAAAPTNGPLSACFEQQRNHASLFVKAADGHLNFFYVNEIGWQMDPVSFQAAGPVTGEVSAFFNPKCNHACVFFKGGDGKLHYFHVTAAGWTHVNEPFASVGEVQNLSACFDLTSNGAVCYVRNAENKLYEIRENGDNWVVDYVEQAGTCLGNVAAVYEPQRQHTGCFFENAEHRLGYLYWMGNWNCDNQSFAENVEGGICAAFSPDRNHSEVCFRDTAGQLQYYFLDASNVCWATEKNLCHTCMSSPFVHMVYEDHAKHIAITFLGTDNKIHYLYRKAQ